MAPYEADRVLGVNTEDPTQPMDTVYAYVPTQFVTYIIAKHGGMVSGGLPNGIFMNKFTAKHEE